MRSVQASLLRKSYAIIALLVVAVFGLMAAPARTSQGARVVTNDAVTLGVPSQLGALVPPVFGPNVRANNDSTVYGQHEPGLAVSRTDPNVVVAAAKDYRNGNVKQVWIDVSTDGGVTWPANKQIQIPGIPADLPIQSDPVVMARDDGRIYVACLGTNSSTSRGGIFITWTDDNGATWRNPSVPVFYPENALDDKDWFAIDNNPSSPYYHRMYMMYAPSADHVVEQHSTDGGVTWSTRQTISASDTEYTYPVVGSDGTVYNFMMLHWGASRTGTVQLTKSTNGGVTWSAPSTVATAQQPAYNIRAGDSFRFFAILSAAVDPADADPSTRDLYVAWTDNRNFATNGVDVMYVKSTNGGQTWGTVTRLSHDPTGVVRDHITPMVVVGADSRVHAFWLDRRLDPNNRFFDSWYSSSTDGGATWDADTRVSTVSQDLNVGFPPGSGNAAGDYWGLDTVGNVVYVAWNDTRSGDQDILVSRGVFGGGTVTPSPVPPSPTRTPTSIPTATRTATATSTNVPPSSTSTATAIAPSPTATVAPPTSTGTTSPPTATATATVPPATSTSTSTAVSPSGTPTSPGATSTATNTPVSPSSTATAIASATTSATSSVTQTPVCLGTWQTIPGPGTDDLTSVAAIAPDDVWAVNGADIFHWDGTLWSAVPHPTDTGYSLIGIEAIGPDDIWAVGSQPGTQLLLSRTLTEHWDGTQWSVVDSPSVGPNVNHLRDVVAIAPDDVWAVGLGGSSSILWSQIMHWDGSSWSDYSMHGGALNSVSATGPDDVWAVGQVYAGMANIRHWDGTTWNGISSPDIGILNAVEAIAPDDVWASSDSAFIHWDGTQWSIVPAPTGASAISAAASNDIWAAGSVLQHWNGVAWEVDPFAPSAQLRAMLAVAANDIWAVGDSSLVLHYTGQRYADVPPDNTFSRHINYMTCLDIMSGYDCGGPGEPCGQDNLPYFRPNNDITRGQLSKIVSNAAGFNEDPGAPIYADVSEDNVFYPYLQRLTHRLVMSGYPCGTVPEEPCDSENRPYFRPFANATRGQISKIVANAAGIGGTPIGQTFEDVPSTHTFYSFIEALANLGVMSGYPCGTVPEEPCVEPDNRPYFRPFANATRGQTSKIVANTFFPGCCDLARRNTVP